MLAIIRGEIAIQRSPFEAGVSPVAADRMNRSNRDIDGHAGDTARSSDESRPAPVLPLSSLAYRTGFYVGALYGYQLVSEVSPVDGSDFCQGFADGIAVITSWLRSYLSEGGTFDSALGELMPYFPALRAWVGDSSTVTTARPARPPSRRERLRRQWEQDICGTLSRHDWLTTTEIAERLNGRGPRNLRTLSQLLDDMVKTGQVERSEIVDVMKPRHRSVRWRLPATNRAATSVS